MRSGTGAPGAWTTWTVPVVVVPSVWAMVDGTGVDSMTRDVAVGSVGLVSTFLPVAAGDCLLPLA